MANFQVDVQLEALRCDGSKAKYNESHVIEGKRPSHQAVPGQDGS
jgi:hypothetical protein